MTGSFFDLTDAFNVFAEASSCDKIDAFPYIYRLIYAASFGGCGLDESSLREELAKIIERKPDELEILGFNAITYPFLLTAIHKSIIYGKMKYTEILIRLAKKVLFLSGSYNEEFLSFYEKIFNLFRAVSDKSDYARLLKGLSEEIGDCNDSISAYKCKILAALGDLDAYEKTRYKGRDNSTFLYIAIDNDLRYIAKKFKYDEIEGKTRFGILRYISVYGVSAAAGELAYLISGRLGLPPLAAVPVSAFSMLISMKLTEEFIELNGKIENKIIPVLLLD